MSKPPRGGDEDIVVGETAASLGTNGCLTLFLGAITWAIVAQIWKSPDLQVVDWLLPLIVLLPLLGASVMGLLAPNCFRIRFADSSYHQRTERDRFTLRWRGRTGSFDEFDCVRISGAQDPEYDTVIWGVHLVWKDRRRSSVCLRGNLTSQATALEWAEGVAGRLGVRLEVVEAPDA